MAELSWTMLKKICNFQRQLPFIFAYLERENTFCMSPNIGRRQFIGMMTLGAAAVVIPGNNLARPTQRHLITLSFDDGFKKSSMLTASIFEKYKLSACINVVATGHLSNFVNPDEYQVTEKGDFGLWNELEARGHEIMPHGYKHANKTTIPLEKAQDLIRACLDYFAEHLKDFNAAQAVFNMPYNASTPELEAWLGDQVLAFRTGGPVINQCLIKARKN